MKAYKTVIFIFSILAMLALVSWSFPTEGIKAGDLTFRFPSLTEVLSTGEEESEEEQQLSPEELLQQRLDAILAAKDNEYLDYILSSEARFHLPDGDLTYFDDFFIRLEHCSDRLVRIIHYGDSQLEEDRITSYLRENVQAKFGGSGIGMLPAVPKSGATLTVAHSIDPTDRIPYYLAYGPATARADHNRYGPMAQIAHIDTTTVINFRTRQPNVFPHCQTFQRVRVRMQGFAGSMSFVSGNNRVQLTCDTARYSKEGTRVFEALLPSPVKSGSLIISGEMDVQSVQLDGTKGVVVDNVAMRGCSGTMFTSIERKSIESFFNDEDVALIILQFGGNAMPYAKSEAAIEKFCNDTRRQIDFFHKIAPDAKILYIGPSDMATSIAGEMHTYPHLPAFVEALQTAVTQSGAAFWNMFEAMGGKDSMTRWVKTSPQLAGDDHIHFTQKGAQRISEILNGTFDIYYNYYRFRNYDRYSMADSISAVCDSI